MTKEQKAAKTLSGAVAVGEPISKERILCVAVYALDESDACSHGSLFDLLELTDEGKLIKCGFEQQSNMNFREKFYEDLLYVFLGGIVFGVQLK